jgi:subtilisin-like proprotein convertase family protein
MRTSVVLAALVALPALASADALRASRGEPLVEVSHTVDVTFADGVATYKVRRQFANPGKVADEAGLAIDLPYGAAATGLRIRAHDTWYDGELMEREKAAALYKELTGFGAYAPKDPALLQWLWADKLYLQIFPVMPGSVSTVEYTLTVPSRYVNGRYWLSYPRVEPSAESHLTQPVLNIHAPWAGAAIAVDGRRVASDTPVVLVPPVRPEWADAVGYEGTASYVASTIEVPESSHTTHEVKSVKLDLDIRHTYKSDLRIELVTPNKESVRVFGGDGGGANDIRGSFTVTLPPYTHGNGTWRLVVSDHAALDTGTLDHWTLSFGDTEVSAADTPVFIPDAPESADDAGVASFSFAPGKVDTWFARFGRVVASREHAFARLEVDVAPRLSELPKHAQVVFAVDASFSIGEEGLAAELDLVTAYASHIPDAEIEIIAYRRHPARLFGSFVPASGIAAALAKHPIALGNGSALDEAATLATRLLAARTGGPRRLVIVTDDLLRTRLDDAAALASLAGLPRDVVVHLVLPHLDADDRVLLARNDTHHLASLATRHHGIFADITGLPAKKDLAGAVLELVRPTRLDALTASGFTLESNILHEGDGLRLMFEDKAPVTHVALAGKLWSDPVRKDLDPGVAFSRQTAAFIFGADEHQQLSHDEMMKVAMQGRAVSPVTSYVAYEPGTRPSVIGMPEERGSFGMGRSGFGSGGGGLGFRRITPNLAALVDPDACERKVKPAPGWSVTLAVETTKREVVDVAIKGTPSPMASCLVEEVWALTLDPSVFDLDREDFEPSW